MISRLQPSAQLPGSWAQANFTAYRVRFGLRTDEPAALAEACAAVPLGWQASTSDQVDVLYSLHIAPAGTHGYHALYCNSALIARSLILPELLAAFNKHAELLTAFGASDYLFVHAGVVGWQGRAIVMPGRSMAGKTTLVQALVAAGALYYSDDFALLDQQGLVHAYPLPLSIRGDAGQPAQRIAVEALGGQVGQRALPLGLLVLTHYQPGAAWRPRRLSPGQALLALMDNSVAARGDPAHSMPILRAAAMSAPALRSARGEAGPLAATLLGMLKGNSTVQRKSGS